MKKIKQILNFYFQKLLGNTVYYFGYGSNTNIERISKRIGYCKKIGNHTVEGYSLIFDTKTSDVSFANLKTNEDSAVEGVVFEVTRQQLDLLCYFEGDGDIKYYQRVFDLYNNKPLALFICFNVFNKSQLRLRGNLTSQSYFDTLSEGYRKAGLIGNLEFLVTNVKITKGKMFD